MTKYRVKISLIATIIVAVALLSGCKNASKDKKPLLPPVTGKPGDITLVIDQRYWESDMGDSLKSVFYREIYGLPAPEPQYDLMQVPHEAFSNLYKKTRNILMIKISDEQTKNDIHIQRNLWAKPQIVMSLVANTPEEAVKTLRQKEERILSIFNDAERQRYRNIYKNSQDNALKARIELKHKIDMVIPNGFTMGMDTVNFTWIDHMQVDNITQGFFIYEYPYTDTATFTKEFLIKKRDQIMRRYVHGSVRGSYMTTETILPPSFNEYVLKGKQYIAELRGLWKMAEGEIMGGPFISYTMLDEARNRVVTVEGYIFAPGHKKRNLIRQIESLLTTIEIKPVKSEGEN
ncbi:MAG: DUF4837 family protein [Bacteroidetes bacterium]|jgi:hypothetical protein|nr:DUF4837 family protein [Bacteroidota bacterium]